MLSVTNLIVTVVCSILLTLDFGCSALPSRGLKNRLRERVHIGSSDPPNFLTKGQSYKSVIGDTLVLPCEVKNLGKSLLFYYLP
ncbi:uncharacterized protein LOC111057107 [Nilaparvata lugens]|uniref:uncharacterized protein LOC111057107 n=1 Tax=Nilaparvata lugens TaxID=108931 RepID=UPI00193D7736|nr:uncharacterized protein LOC111057107 [Nilaparvata lugens]